MLRLVRRSLRLPKGYAACVAFGLAAFGAVAQGQQVEIGIIDLYGLSRVSAGEVRGILTFAVGDTVTIGNGVPAVLQESKDRLAQSPAIARAQTRLVCCDQGQAIVYVGIEERGAPARARFHAEPTGNVRLPAQIVRAGEEVAEALRNAVMRGAGGEDWSQGHALADDPTVRAIQERFLLHATRSLRELQFVLRNSSSAAHRALAAQVLGYAENKQAVVNDLVLAMNDRSAEVRNNAMRALLVFASMRPVGRASVPRVPAQPFIELLHSPVWSDRNKASLALAALSAGRDPATLAMLRETALTPLIEMAAWRSEGHALPAFLILGRIADYADATVYDLWNGGDREAVINAARMRIGRSR